jgi:hypothetical protein
MRAARTSLWVGYNFQKMYNNDNDMYDTATSDQIKLISLGWVYLPAGNRRKS